MDSSDKVLCRRCGRVLKGEKSKELGFGPNCYKIWKNERFQRISLFDKGDGNDREKQEDS